MESGRKDGRTPRRERVHLGAGAGEAFGVRLSLLPLLLRDFHWLENIRPAALPESQVMPVGGPGHSRDAAGAGVKNLTPTSDFI